MYKINIKSKWVKLPIHVLFVEILLNDVVMMGQFSFLSLDTYSEAREHLSKAEKTSDLESLSESSGKNTWKLRARRTVVYESEREIITVKEGPENDREGFSWTSDDSSRDSSSAISQEQPPNKIASCKFTFVLWYRVKALTMRPIAHFLYLARAKMTWAHWSISWKMLIIRNCLWVQVYIFSLLSCS